MTIRMAGLVAGLCFLVGGAIGWCVARRGLSPTPAQIVEVETIQEKVVTKTVTVKEAAPDGTTKETVTTTSTADTTKKSSEPKAVQPVSVSAGAVRADWSLGVSWQPDWRDRTWIPAQGEVGYRVVSDFWVTGAYNWKEQHALLGLRYEF